MDVCILMLTSVHSISVFNKKCLTFYKTRMQLQHTFHLTLDFDIYILWDLKCLTLSILCGLFIPATTANDLWLRRISIQNFIPGPPAVDVSTLPLGYRGGLKLLSHKRKQFYNNTDSLLSFSILSTLVNTIFALVSDTCIKKE